MHIKNNYIKLLFNLFISISIFECIYLFAMPKILNELAGKNFVKKILNENTNTDINFSSVEFKTHINPNITIKLNNLHIKDKENNVSFFNSDYINADIYILPIISKKIRFKQLDAGIVNANIIRDKDGKFNIEKLFPNSKKSSFKIDYKKSALNINEYNIKSNDEILNQYIEITGSPLKIKSSKKSVLDILTKGQIKSNDNISDFDINMKTKYPVKSNFNSDFFSGSCILYNINLKPFLPFIQSYINKDISDFEGFIDFIQISADKSDDNKINVILNTKFKNLIFNKKDWETYINANGENKIDANVELYDNTVNFKSFNFKADNVNIKSDGSINFESTPVLNINAEVENSRAENILSILPPNLVPQNMIIQKVKRYGVYGDIEGKVNINGKIPQPDVTGYVKAKNIKTLDKSIHPLHNGSVDITFDKRILNMDILIDFFDNQNAKINGYVYMYRDGINNVTIKTTNNIDFPLAQKIVVPVSKVFNFQIGPIPDMNIKSGKGIIDVNIQGSPDFININGYSSFDKVYLTYNGLFGEILNGKGRLDFKEDVVSFKSERAFVKDNPLTVEGNVRINKDLDFNISSDKAEAKDLLELINKSELLKDVKDGIVLITDADGLSKIFVNIKAKIVPVEYGQPPLPPEEAFEDMKVNGFLSLLGNSCYIEGFKIPVEKIKGLVEFTESTVDIHDIEGISGTSPITIGGNIITDLKTKIPDVNITITGKSVNLKDTIKFLTQSYLYPQNYPDLSFLYNIASKHDLYFKYKAKSIDFLTDKAYAVMNFINDETNSALKAKSGKIIMDKANVKVENVIAGLFDSNLTVNGDVKKIDTLNPIYNLTIKTDNFNLKNINNLKQTNIVPDEIENIFAQFDSCKGIANIDTAIDKNKLKGNIRFVKPEFRHIKTNTPFIFDDFNIKFNNDSVLIDNVSAKIAEMPFFGNISAENIYKNPNFKGYFTSKVTNDFVKNYLPEEISKRLVLTGDINLSSEFNGNKNNLYIEPKLTLNPEADVITNGASLGEITDKREFNGKININKNEIVIKKLDYVKYVSSQNNTVYPILFATINGILKINEDNLAELEEISIKTYKNLSAKILNMLLNNSFFKQGTFNCDLKYKFNKLQKIPELTGEINCENIDIPLFDILIKNIKLNAKDEVIGLHLFGFLNDSRFNITSEIDNNLSKIPDIKSLYIHADQIDTDKLLSNFAKTKQALEKNESSKSKIADIQIKNGFIDVKKFTIKSLTAENISTYFSIDKDGILYADDINVNVGQGNISGKMSFNLKENDLKGDFEVNNVDANYMAETLFDGKNQIYGNASGKIIVETKGLTDEEIIKNLNGFMYFDITDGKMPKLGSLEYLLRASNVIKSGITGFTLNNILEILNLVKTGYFSNIYGSCAIENGIAKNIEIFSKGENLSLYIHGTYDISKTNADMEVLGKLSKKISTIFGTLGNISLNTFFKLIPGISILDFGRKNFVEDVEKIPSFTNGDYESRIFQAVINGNINETNYVQSFKWVK